MTAIISKDLDLSEVVQLLLKKLAMCPILLLSGDLGAGKTTLVKAIAGVLGSKDDVSSPSFSLINEYEYDDGFIYHMDMYRLHTIDEAIEIGIEEYLDSKEICIIEWPELIMPLLSYEVIHVFITVNGEGDRIFQIQ